MTDWLTQTLAAPMQLATEPKPIAKHVQDAHDAQVERLKKAPVPPARGTMRWSAEIGAFVLQPGSDSDLWEHAIKGIEVQVEITL